MGTDTTAMIATLSSPAFLTLAFAIFSIENAMNPASIVCCVIDKQATVLTLIAEPRQRTTLASTAGHIELAAVLAILGTLVLAIKSPIRRIAILANALLGIKQAPASAIVIASVALVTRIESVAFACAGIGIKRAMSAVKMAFLACLAAPIAIALARAVVLGFAMSTAVLVTRALACAMVKLAFVHAAESAIVARGTLPITLAVHAQTTNLASTSMTGILASATVRSRRKRILA